MGWNTKIRKWGKHLGELERWRHLEEEGTLTSRGGGHKVGGGNNIIRIVIYLAEKLRL